MTMLELAQKVKESNKEKLDKMNERRIAFIIKESLAQIISEIEKEDSVVRIPGFGIFRIKTVEREKDDNKTHKKRFIIFNPKTNKQVKDKI